MSRGSADLRPARVRVPASTSNLGPGFDVLGLAFDRGLDVAYEVGDDPLEVVREGFARTIPDDRDRVLGAFRDGLPEGTRATGRLVVRAEVPAGRGLGSSAAAWIAGNALARAALGDPLDRVGLFRRATEAEGHPDNAAPAAFGGLVAVARGVAGLDWARLPLSPAVGFAFAEPGVAVSTAAARRALPETVPHGLVSATAGRLALLLHGLATADPEAIGRGTFDETHVPYRLGAVPGGSEAIEAGVAAGAWSVTLSGSGSGLLALGPPAACAEVAEAMAGAFRRAGAPGGEAWPLRPDPLGVRLR